jgi:hypothetical protein
VSPHDNETGRLAALLREIADRCDDRAAECRATADDLDVAAWTRAIDDARNQLGRAALERENAEVVIARLRRLWPWWRRAWAAMRWLRWRWP